MFDEYPNFLSVAECCDILLCEKHTVYELVHSGQLHAIRSGNKLWRIPKSALAKYCLESSGILIEEEKVDDYF